MKPNKRNYANYSKNQETPIAPEAETKETVEPAASITEDNPEPETTDGIVGVVTECARLRVRKEPSLEADILTVIPLGTEVRVDIFESTNDFYKICTGNGVEGYCMQKYINVN